MGESCPIIPYQELDTKVIQSSKYLLKILRFNALFYFFRTFYRRGKNNTKKNSEDFLFFISERFLDTKINSRKQNKYPKYDKSEIQKCLTNICILEKNYIITSHKLHYVNPSSVYSPISAHLYFKRYAKNHGKDLSEILSDITILHSRELDQKI